LSFVPQHIATKTDGLPLNAHAMALERLCAKNGEPSPADRLEAIAIVLTLVDYYCSGISLGAAGQTLIGALRKLPDGTANDSDTDISCVSSAAGVISNCDG
jgi:hypothetical protein